MINVSRLNSHNCFFPGLNNKPKPTTDDIMMTIKTDNKLAESKDKKSGPLR